MMIQGCALFHMCKCINTNSFELIIESGCSWTNGDGFGRRLAELKAHCLYVQDSCEWIKLL